MSIKTVIKRVGYAPILFLHKLRMKTARGWRKTYLSFLTPPSDVNSLDFQYWLRLGEFDRVLETHHSDLLNRPFAKLLYKLDYFLSAVLLGADNENYFRFLFYKCNWANRNKNITSRRLSFLYTQLNDPALRCYLDDKTKFANHWQQFFHRAYCNLSDPKCTKDTFTETFKHCKKVIVKPLAGMRGDGIQILEVENNLPQLYDALKANSEEMIVEEYISQTGLLHTFNPTSLNTVRVITLREDGEVTILASTLRVGGKDAVIDNLHAGGCGYTVYPENGKVYSGLSMSGQDCTAHPDTGLPIAGHTIPRWEEVKQFCIDAHAIAPSGLDYIGWDVCICEDELYMIEGNACPSAPPCVEDQNHWDTVCAYFDRHPELQMKDN